MLELQCLIPVERRRDYSLLQTIVQAHYLAQGENRKTVRGVKGMKAEDLPTAYICSDVNGTARTPTSLSGTAIKSRCFRIREPLIPRYH